MINTESKQPIGETVRTLINTGHEGQYWDFKQEWYSNKASMLHDILCMANNPDQHDSYLIIGVDDNCKITGVENDIRRKTTQMLNDFLREKNFSDGIRPELYVENINIDNHQVDVIVIKNSDKTPFALAGDYTDGNKTVHRNNIYSRIHDSNTPIDKTSSPTIVEELYKKRLYIDSDPLKKFEHYLDDIDGWRQCDDIDGEFYYANNTKMTLKLTDENDSDRYSNFLCKIWPSKSAKYDTARLIYENITVSKIRHAGLDDHRIDVIEPDHEYVDISKASNNTPDYREYYYVIAGSILDKFNKFLLRKHYVYGQSEFMLKKWSGHIIYFKDDNEKAAFDKYINSNVENVYEVINNTECPFATNTDRWTQIDIDSYKSTLAIKSLFIKWRATSTLPLWRSYKLSELGAIIGGGTPSTHNASYFDGDIPWITPNDLSHYKRRYISRGERNITKKGLASCSAKLLPAGTVLFSSRAPIGYVAIAENPVCTNQGFKNIIPFNSSDSLFLYYLLKTLGDKIEQYASGATFKEISGAAMGEISISIPSSKSVRSNISHVLSTIDCSIENTYLTDSYLKRILNHVYNYWFVQFDFPDENGRPYKSSGGKMAYNEQLKQEIPVGWETKKLLDLFSFERGTEVGSAQYSNYKVDDDYVKFYRVRDVGDDSSTWVSEKNDLRIVKPGDVVITLDGTVGKIGIDIDGAISGGLRHVVDHSHRISNSMIWSILSSYYIQESLRRYVSGRGSILAHAGGAINDLSIPYSEHIFKKFQNVTDPMFALMVNCQQESKLLASLRDWLLPMLMNGQIEIKDEQQE